jgi:hypothetical protein
MKIITVILFITFLSSCETQEDKLNERYSERQYILITTHDGNWTHSAKIFCDSINMINTQEVDVYVDGRKMSMEAPQFRIYNNPKYIKK